MGYERGKGAPFIGTFASVYSPVEPAGYGRNTFLPQKVRIYEDYRAKATLVQFSKTPRYWSKANALDLSYLQDT